MVDEGTNYESSKRPVGWRRSRDTGHVVEELRTYFDVPSGEMQVRELELPEVRTRLRPSEGKRPSLWSRIVDTLLPVGRSESMPSPPAGGTKEPQAVDPVLELAYDAVTERLKSQSTTLESLRTRATGILSVGALVTSFAAGIGMINTDPAKGDLLPTWAPWVLLGILFVMGYFVMVVLWPYKKWGYGPSGRVILQLRELGKSEDEVREMVTSEMLAARQRNEEQLVMRAWAYRGAVVLLLAETLVLVAAIAQQSAT